MDVSSVKAKIQSKTVPDFLIFTGPEWEVQKIYIQHIADSKRQVVCRIDSVGDVYNKLKNRSFLAESACYVVRDDAELLGNDKLQQQIASGILGDNTLILLLTTVDKRTKFYKKYKDTIVEFEALKPMVLHKYLKQALPELSDRNCGVLMDVCENDYGRCLSEIDKIKRYAEVKHIAYDDAVEYLLKTGVIYQPPQDAIFDCVDAILDRKVNMSFDLLRQGYAVGEATMVFISVLYNNAKAVLQVQTCGSKDISKSTGLTGWQIKNAMPHKNKYSTSELLNMLDVIRYCEKGIKTGTVDEKYAMEYILVNVI